MDFMPSIPYLVAILGIFFLLTIVSGLLIRRLFELLEAITKQNRIAPVLPLNILRLLDTSIAIGGLIFSFPLMLIISIAIKINSSGHIFYKRIYCGANRKEFQTWIFRTMVDGTEKIANRRQHLNLASPPTFLGRVLRNTGFDELPLLINVLKGDMSIVGPRPVTPEQNDALGLYTEEVSIKPGFIDIAYSNRYAKVPYASLIKTFPHICTLQKKIILDDKERLAYDRSYIKNPSKRVAMRVLLDFLRIQPTRILCKIIPVFEKK